MRFLVILIALPLLTYGGIKSYLLYNLKTSLDNSIAQLAPSVAISYDTVFSSIDGSVGISDVVIKPKMNDDEFTIAEISVKRDNLLSLLATASEIKDGKFPQQMEVGVKQFSIDLDSKVFSMASAMPTKSNSNYLETYSALGCGDVEKFGMDEYIKMGYTKMVLDVGVNYEYLPQKKLLKYKLSLKDRDQYNLGVGMQFVFDPSLVKAGLKGVSEPAIKQLSVNYSDTGFYKLRNKYCAKQAGVSVEDYAKQHLKLLSALIDGQLPENAIDAYRKFILQGGTMSVSLNPSEALTLSELKFYKQFDIMELLGLKVAVNRVLVDSSKIAWQGKKTNPKATGKKQVMAKSKTAKPLSHAANKSTKSRALNDSRRLQKIVSNRTGYHPVNKKKISHYVGKNVQINTSRGKFREGILESVTPEKVRLIIRIRGGEYELPIKQAEISELKVFL